MNAVRQKQARACGQLRQQRRRVAGSRRPALKGRHGGRSIGRRTRVRSGRSNAAAVVEPGVAADPGEFRRCPFGRSVPENPVDARDAGGRAVRANACSERKRSHHCVVKNRPCSVNTKELARAKVEPTTHDREVDCWANSSSLSQVPLGGAILLTFLNDVLN